MYFRYILCFKYSPLLAQTQRWRLLFIKYKQDKWCVFHHEMERTLDWATNDAILTLIKKIFT